MNDEIKIGEVFGDLVIEGIDESSKVKNGESVWKCLWKYKCRCGCGRYTSVNKYKLRTGHTTSCGCKRGETSEVIIFDDVALITLTNEDTLFAIIDSKDIYLVKGHAWYKSIRGSIESRFDGKLQKLHRIITAKKFKKVDHANGDTLDNRRLNLRKCTSVQNSGNTTMRNDNTSGYRGVRRRKRKDRKDGWTSTLIHEGKSYYIGSGQDPKLLSEKYNELEKKLRGEFASANRPTNTILDQGKLLEIYKVYKEGDTKKAEQMMRTLLENTHEKL